MVQVSDLATTYTLLPRQYFLLKCVLRFLPWQFASPFIYECQSCVLHPEVQKWRDLSPVTSDAFLGEAHLGLSLVSAERNDHSWDTATLN